MDEQKEKRNRIIEKVRKLSDFANHQDYTGTNMEAEAKVASEKMQELMNEYAITWADILSSNEKERVEFVSQKSNKRMTQKKAWTAQLALAIAKITRTKNYCSLELIKNSNGNFVDANFFCFYGIQETAVLAASLFDKWVDILEYMAVVETKNYSKKLVEQEKEFARVSRKRLDLFKQGYLLGLSVALSEKYKNGSVEQEEALVVYDHALAEKFYNFSKNFKVVKNKMGSNLNAEGYYKGREDGKGININQKEFESSGNKKEKSVLLLN